MLKNTNTNIKGKEFEVMKKYVVSKDMKSGLWYAHREDFPHIPISGSFSEKKSESREYAKMYMGLQNKVKQIEEHKHEKFMKEMELV